MSLFSLSVRVEVLLALELYRRELFSQGLPVSSDLADFTDFIAGRDMTGQGTAKLGDLVDLLQAGRMSPLLLPLEQAAEMLGGVNVRTVKRYIADGLLPATKLGGRTMVRLTDLETFVARLGPHSFREDVRVKDASAPRLAPGGRRAGVGVANPTPEPQNGAK